MEGAFSASCFGDAFGDVVVGATTGDFQIAD